MLRLYDYLESGNGYKVRLLLNQLRLPFERIELDILQGETRTAQFLVKNPNGRIPLLELEDGTCLAESNAIQWYLADTSPTSPCCVSGTTRVSWQRTNQRCPPRRPRESRLWA
jgi:glutathione S-transferase